MNAIDEFEDVDPVPALHLSHNGGSAKISAKVSIPEASQTSSTLILKQPVWTDTQVDETDSRYFHFFLFHGKDAVLHTQFFPRAINEIFARTLNNRLLQRSVLAVSSMSVDESLRRPLVRALTHKQQAIALLQQSLSTGDITEEVAISIFLLLYMDCFRGKEISQGHLRGIYLVLKHMHIDLDDPFVWKNMSPVLMLIWRITISMDVTTSAVQRTVPVLPPFPTESNVLHKAWATSLSNDVRSVDLALALFAIDDLSHRANHWLRECEIVMASSEYINNPHTQNAYNVIIESRIASLREEHANWLQDPARALAMQMELNAQLQIDETSSNLPKFLDYPPLVVYDRTFAVLLNQWRLLSLFISFFP